ncbi:electron transport complex subunit RsxC [Ectothiorhodospira sp. BSL-9]|uniref:electron transport complex subunit RsxC n=1 Tax=Ectothiorhodospira sp. BSL-9 TaxID=1442136 RepID=UPI0007B442FF|nr:electron transport complex subunit RsxC [Ectothiorhodospira sp. BSL-9]ANB01496.1 RnfABCDGE type electron transport complex subunit C [Ectothiorhodospira sp. BSL-9]TVQ74585.1 MAG: electron transport complex subunit RsxC [Chromatiaceae bacterium]
MTSTPHKLWRFNGGLKLPDHKAESTQETVFKAPLAEYLTLPLRQHIGEMAQPVVKAGDKVYKGQIIARCDTYVGAHIHAPTSGRVRGIEEHPVPHPSGLTAPCVVIEVDGDEDWGEHRMPPIEDLQNLDPARLRHRVREGGLVGMGGAAFPSAVKLNPRPQQAIDTLVVNGAECEPYITCDDMLMRTRADAVIQGLLLVKRTLQPRQCLIGIEDNKPEALRAMTEALGGEENDNIRIVALPSIYPAGGERQLIRVLTGREVPSEGLPADVGVVCHNVGTLANIYRAVIRGEPLISRIVTVTGSGVKRPRNLRVPFGTPISHLVAHAGGYSDDVERLIMGGPMMGFALASDQVPIVKGTNCILAARGEEVDPPGPVMPCIRCGECVRVCPANLLPQQLYWFTRARDFDKAQDYSLFDCIECGCCAHVCPSNIPLVQFYRFAKNEIWSQEREKQEADAARVRHEMRQERLAREKREKAERMNRKKQALNDKPAEDKAADTGNDPKKAAIQAALERAQAKKAAQGADTTPPDQGKPPSDTRTQEKTR